MSTRPEGPGSWAAWSQGSAGLDPERGPTERRYARGGELGRGGMGVVESALDTWLDRDVAVKRPRSDRGDELARLGREARITARLVHPAIPPVYDVGEDDQGPYYTMPVLVGATLEERLRDGQTPLSALVASVARACRAAGYAHARGVVHRDLKPANLLLGDHGEVWVLDWGVAYDPAWPDEAAVGTPGFQAPEVEGGGRPTPASDVFSLGRTLGLALDARPGAPPELKAIAARATQAQAADRYPDGGAMAEDIERWQDGHLVEAHRYPARELLGHLIWRWRAPLAVAAVAAVVVSALGTVAWRAQRAERQRADRHLSVSLARQAEALRLEDARPEAEVLAAWSLALADNPLARGVLMAWSAADPLALTQVVAPPCLRPFVEPDGHLICAGESLALYAPDGAPRWSGPAISPEGAGSHWVGPVVEARRYEGDVVVTRRSSNHVEIWRDGRPQRTLGPFADALGLTEGPVPAIHDRQRIGRIDLTTGSLEWGPPTCDLVETALVRNEGVMVGCRGAQAFVGPFEAPEGPLDLPGSPSALAWVDGPLVGTFEGRLVRRVGEGWESVDAGVGAVRQLLPLPGGLVAVVGERRQLRIRSPHGWVGAVPRGAVAAAVVGSDLVVLGEGLRHYHLPEGLRPVTFDRRDEGGIASFDLSPSGETLVAGSATGEVVSWDLRTGAPRSERPPGPATAKPVAFLDDRQFIRVDVDGGTWRQSLGSADATVLSSTVAQGARRQAGGVVLLPWSAGVVLWSEAGERKLSLPSRPLASAEGLHLWVADEGGAVHALEGDHFEERFELASPTASLAVSADRLVVAQGHAVEARSFDGALEWRWVGAAPVTALAATPEWIAAGDLEGRVLVFGAGGEEVAAIPGHTRRVSGLIIKDRRLYSASWDGLVRVWDLERAAATPLALVDQVGATWGLGLDEALGGVAVTPP